MPIQPTVCTSESTVTIEPLTCDKDSVTICPPGDAAPFHVIVDSTPPVSGAGGGATETTLAAILVELGQKLEPGGEVALSAATLAALESITVTVTNPTTSPETGLAKEVTLAALLTELGQKYEGGAVALDAPTLAALETVTVLQGTSPWVVNVDNFPAGTVGLTDAELRATPVPISGTVTANLGTIDGVATETTLAALLVELGQKYEGGAVALDAATLAALETITVNQGTSPWVVSGSVAVTGEVEVKNDTGNPLPIDDAQSNKRFKPGVRTTLAFQISTIGDNIIVTPTAGMRLRVTWIGMSSPDVGIESLTIVKFGAAGAAKYRWYMGAPGAFSHWEAIEGAVDESLIVNLSVGTTIQVSTTFEEF